MKYLILILSFIVHFNNYGQEVLNGSFEDREFDPDPPVDFNQIDNCEHWATATYSSDWLSPEMSSHTLFGYDPRTGTGHARFAGTSGNGSNPSMEMIRGQIIDLVAGEEYQISFWVKRIDGATSMNVGAYISTSIPTIHENPGDPYTQSHFPQIVGAVPAENDEYMQVLGCYTPIVSGLHYITIGVFELYPEVEGIELNFFIVDDVNISLASGSLPSGSIDLASEYCVADDIIADGSSASDYDYYQWLIYSDDGELILASEVFDGSVSTFDVRGEMFMNGTPLQVGECYIVKLILQGNCTTEISKEICIATTSVNLSSIDDPPYCEGESITINSDGELDWDYEWSTGASGVGISSITVVASLGIDMYTVTATTPTGCSVNGFLPVTVHPAENTPPSVTSETFTYYTYPGEELCFGIYSTDYYSEEVTITIDDISPPLSLFNFSPLGDPGDFHESLLFCWTPSKYDYGEHYFTVNLQDNNACGVLSQSYTYKVEVLCPLCPKCVYYEGNTPESDPLPELTEAAKCIEAGFSEPVVVGDESVEFRAGEYIELGDFFVEGPFFAEVEGISCAAECAECCEDWTGFTFDELPNVFSPNGDGINDYWFLNDSDHSYCAFNALGYRLRVAGRWAGAGIIYEKESTPGYCCPFEAANVETGLEMTEINWGGYTDGGALVADGVYDVYIDLYGCYSDTLLWAEVQVIGGELSMINIDSDSNIGDSIYYLKESFLTPVDSIKPDPFFNSLELIVYPSPTTGYINITAGRNKLLKSNIFIYNSQGELLYQQNMYEVVEKIDVSDWASGIYTVILRSEAGILQTKFVKL